MAVKTPILRLCEWLLRRVLPHRAELSAVPLDPPPRRLLVAKAAGMGDGVLIRSLVEHLRAQNPGLEIGVLVCPPSREAMSCASDFHVHFYDPNTHGVVGALRTLAAVRAARYDAAISFEQRSQLAALFFWLARIPRRLGFLSAGLKSNGRFLTHGFRMNRDLSMWRNFAGLARLVDPRLPEDLSTLPLTTTGDAQRWLERWFAQRLGTSHGRVVALHLGSGPHAYRRWPLERFVALADELQRAAGSDLIVVLTGTKSERSLIERFIAAYSGVAVDASGLDSLEKTALLLARCDLLVSLDTGVMHLGAAMGTPTVGLFGVSSPSAWAPVGPRARFVYAAVACSPCWNPYLGTSPERCANPIQGRCMEAIGVAQVMAAARDVIDGGWLNSGCAERPGVAQAGT